MKRYYGKYMARVVDNVDPLELGRILCTIPAFEGTALAWCLPCVPYAGPEVGMYFIPPIGASVWVEFAGGDLDVPIWVGCFWDEGEVPLHDGLADPKVSVLRTGGISLVFNELPGVGGATLSVGPPAVEIPMTISMSPEGVSITLDPATKITMTEAGINLTVPPASVSISEAEIGLEIPESSVTLTEASTTIAVPPAAVEISAETIAAEVAPSFLDISAEGIISTAGPAVVAVTEEAIEVSNDASNISVFPVGVVVNDGALEVL